MPKRSPNPNRVKIHRVYTFAKLARVLDVHKNTITRWVGGEGLPAVTDQRPHLLCGAEVKSFLIARHARRRSKCPPGHAYCFRCRTPRPPVPDLVEYIPAAPSHGRIETLCSVCETVMSRAIRASDLGEFGLDIDTQTHWPSND
jgi:hypothetical protein